MGPFSALSRRFRRRKEDNVQQEYMKDYR